jgi:4-diphosphocytidyl-2C-methyl-D-erythritol kinase
MYVGPDDAGQQGIFLYKDLPVEAGLALEKCLKKITPQIMVRPVTCYKSRVVVSDRNVTGSVTASVYKDLPVAAGLK